MKKIQAILMAAVLLLGCFSAALAEKYPAGTLYKGMKGHTDEIRQLQQWLIDLGYLDDKADGKFGQNTQAAVKAFQKDRGLTADGIAWPETLELVEIYTNEPLVEYPEGTLHKGIYGHTEEIEFLQYQLFYAGYLGDDISVVDGVFGSKTEAAVRQFQKEHNIDVTGIVCPNTQTALDEEWENQFEPQPLEDEYEEAYPYCYVEHYANGTQGIVLCSKHMDVYAQASGALAAAQENDAQTIAALKSNLQLWQSKVEEEYQLKANTCLEEYKPLWLNHQAAFMSYYAAQMALVNAAYGEGSMAALDRACTLLSDHCAELCAYESMY